MTWLLRILLPTLLSSVFYFLLPFQSWWQLSLGFVLGSWLVVVDRYLSRWYRDPAAASVGAVDQLLSNSVLIVAAFMAVSLYEMISGTSTLGKGVVVAWHLMTLWQWWLWLPQPDRWRSQVWWQVRWQPTDDQVTYLVWGYTGLVALVVGLLLLFLF